MADYETPKELQQQMSERRNSSFDAEFEDGGHLLENDGSSIQEIHIKTRRNRTFICVTIANIILFCSSILIAKLGCQSCKTSESIAIKKTQAFSPIYNSFTPSLHETTFNETLFNYPLSPYRADPSKEVDSLWKIITPADWLLFTRSDIEKLGKDPSTRAKASPALLTAMGHKLDEEMYFGMIDAFHQTHCLDVIRKHAYWDYYYTPFYGSWEHAHELHWTHLSHCIEMIRQDLVCSANADIITAVWRERQDTPYPDFNMNKKCGDFEGLLEYQEKKVIPMELVEKYGRRPEKEDIETLFPAQPEAYLVKGMEYPKGYVVDHEVAEHRHWYSSW